METKLSSSVWHQHQHISPLIFNIPYQSVDIFPIFSDINSNKSFLHSQKIKENIFEAKKTYLDHSLMSIDAKEPSSQRHDDNEEKPYNNNIESASLLSSINRKSSSGKKISFKIKKQASLYYKRNILTPLNNNNNNKITNVPANKVAELTKKFNEMVERKNYFEDAKVKRIINRDESIIISGKKSSSVVYRDSVKISRKPSVKTKPSLSSTIAEQKNIVIIKTTRKNSVKKSNINSDNNNKLINNTRAKFQKTIFHESSEQLLSQQNKIMQQTSSSQQQQNNSVKATIEIFEKRSSVCLPAANVLQSPNNNNNNINNKPAVPEKSTVVKLLQNKITNQKNVSKPRISTRKNEETDSLEFAEEKVEIINIPAVLPQRRCDSMYETLNMKKIQPETIKAQSVDNLIAVPNSSFLWKDKSPSSSRNSINNVASAPEIPPKPLLIKKTIKQKMPLPSSLESQHHQYEEEEEEEEADIVGYEEIKCNNKNPSPITTTSNDEKFTNYDEITTKAITEFKTDELSILEKENYDEIINNKQEKIYEELNSNNNNNKIDDGYEPIGNQSENIYETLRAFPLRRAPQLPLPPRPPSSTRTEDTTTENCYESIYTTTTKKEGFYESIYGSQLTADSSGSNRDSVVSSEQKTNSIYGQPILKWDYNSDNNSNTYYKPSSDLTISADDRSDEWEDFSDNEEDGNHIIVVREKNRSKKNGWSHHFREQLSKNNNSKEIEELPDSSLSDESDHHYESLYSTNNKDVEDFCYDSDSFESDTESEISLEKIRFVDYNGMDITSAKLPEIPNNQSNGIMKFAEKNMKKLGRNFTKSFTRMKKHISIKADSTTEYTSKKFKPKPTISIYENVESRNNSILKPLLSSSQPIIIETPASPSPESHPTEETDKNKPPHRVKEGFLTKFRRSMSLSAETAQEVTSNLNKETKTKSTFYLTETIDVDSISSENPNESDKSLSPVLRNSRSPLITRPKCPPPPAPLDPSLTQITNRRDGKSNTWYAADSVLKNREQQTTNKIRPNTTFWYAEIGLYHPQNNNSTPSTSSENSGSNLSTTIPIKPFEIPRPVIKPFDYNNIIINHDDNESLNNFKNNEDNIYYTESINSFGSTETKQDESFKQEIQLRLQDEPLYQFYDAAVFESISYDITKDFDSDNYEDVTEKEEKIIKIRPSAMELVTPQRNSICFTKTLWCEIPEVIHSSVLSSLNPHQKKLQEAKFEILTSEASYLNSLNVLIDHFISNFKICQILRKEEMDILFGHVEEVRTSSEKLLHDLEKCWQDNVLLHGICDVIQKHADENFNVYIAYCENQVLFDDVLKSLKDRAGFSEFLKQLELSEKCQSLTLYSFLMLPMQRITRWPLLVDAVLKRLLEQDPEYFACQYALATVNKIVSQCNEAARQKERLNELLKISKKIEFPDSMLAKINIVTPDRWLIRCGGMIHMQSRNEDTTKLTFGKRFTKNTITMILFNNLFIIAKEKGDAYVVQQYCPRNMVELSTTDEMLTVPSAKEAQQKNLIFLTVLENQDGKTVEYLLSCNSETDKERWVEALTPLKSENPEETLYECWDCPQVSAVHNYTANQSDELGLNKGDVINVLRKMADGWYQGIRLRDGESGWFPANHTVEIANYHVRARNLKQRYRLLAFSGNYLKSK